MSKGLVRVVTLLGLLFTLIACSPKLDWRTVQAPQERYTALFPGKPDKLERQLSYQGQELLQVLEAVKIDDDIYSISSIKLLPTQALFLPTLIEQLQSNLLDRAKAAGGSAETIDSSYQNINKQRLPSKDYFVFLKSNGNISQLMRVRWITRAAPNGDMWIYQVSVLRTNAGAENAKSFLSKEEYENFFNDFSPE